MSSRNYRDHNENLISYNGYRHAGTILIYRPHAVISLKRWGWKGCDWFDSDFGRTPTGDGYESINETIILPITKLQVRHLSFIGEAYTGKTELHHIPWIIEYIKEVLHEE